MTRASRAGAEGFTGTPTGDECPQRPGERPFISLSARVDMALASYKHWVWRILVRSDFSEPWCTIVPAYTGGEDIAARPVAVDGQLRMPQCFGSRGEPWAQTGEDDCGDTLDVLKRLPVDAYPAPSVRVLHHALAR